MKQDINKLSFFIDLHYIPGKYSPSLPFHQLGPSCYSPNSQGMIVYFCLSYSAIIIYFCGSYHQKELISKNRSFFIFPLTASEKGLNAVD